METERDILRKVRRLEIKSRGLSSEIFAGQYHSAFRGRGMSFSEVREYRVGDDVRDIDWNVTARSSKPHIKIYEEERELTVMLVVDVSASSDFGTTSRTKRALQTEIAAVLAFSASQTGDKVGCMMFAGGVEKFIPPAKGRAHILRIIRELLGTEETANSRSCSPAVSGRGGEIAFASFDTAKEARPQRPGAGGARLSQATERTSNSKQTSLSEPLRHLTNVLPKRATTFVLSDFLFPAVDEAPLRDALKIATGKHDIVAIRVEDRREAEMPDVGILQARDIETGQRLWVDTSSARVRDRYAAGHKARVEAVDAMLKHYKVDTARVSTGEDYVKELVKLFKKR